MLAVKVRQSIQILKNSSNVLKTKGSSLINPRFILVKKPMFKMEKGGNRYYKTIVINKVKS
jgi:hypothetical protein